MLIPPVLLDILKYTISGAGVVWIAFYLIKPFIERSERVQLLEYKKSSLSQTLPLRLQAYERLVLFIERVDPANLLLRLNSNTYSGKELHYLIVEEIRSEYQHNITQQIYVSIKAWSIIKQIKDDTLGVVNGSFRELGDSGSGLDLSRLILGHLAQLENNPYDIACKIVKSDLEGLF